MKCGGLSPTQCPLRAHTCGYSWHSLCTWEQELGSVRACRLQPGSSYLALPAAGCIPVYADPPLISRPLRQHHSKARTSRCGAVLRCGRCCDQGLDLIRPHLIRPQVEPRTAAKHLLLPSPEVTSRQQQHHLPSSRLTHCLPCTRRMHRRPPNLLGLRRQPCAPVGATTVYRYAHSMPVAVAPRRL